MPPAKIPNGTRVLVRHEGEIHEGTLDGYRVDGAAVVRLDEMAGKPSVAIADLSQVEQKHFPFNGKAMKPAGKRPRSR